MLDGCGRAVDTPKGPTLHNSSRPGSHRLSQPFSFVFAGTFDPSPHLRVTNDDDEEERREDLFSWN
jgi:hypothetical protein